jgi:type I restriction enzyme R subunit
MAGHTEYDFEKAIEYGLIKSGGYKKGKPTDFDENLALFPSEVVAFLKDSQAQRWAQLEKLLADKTQSVVLDSLAKELNSKGTLHVLRHGFKCYGKTLRLAYFQPNSGLNPDTAVLYAKNRLTVTRQVTYTSVAKKSDGKHRKCILDVTIAVNGLPVATAELKNQQTGQTAKDAIKQYCADRDGRDQIFDFKKRALVHFAVDTDEVWMTTQLRGKETSFLPFNKGYKYGAGNPPEPDNWKSAYLWDEVLARDSLLDILQRFMHLEVKTKKITTQKGSKTVTRETMIFPRYHQLDAVRKLVSHAKENGSGRNYLIQPSAGSG